MGRFLLTLRRADAVVPEWIPVLSPVGRDAASCIDYPFDTSRVRLRGLVLLASAFLVVVLIQSSMGAFRAEPGLYSDDAAHFMNGLLIRDYILQGFGSNPMQFAEEYYLNYPKIAPLMWPPLFHFVLGIALLIGWSPALTALLLVGFAAAACTYRLYRIVERMTGGIGAVVAAVLFVSTPMVMALTSVVMLDVLVAALSLEAAYWLARFVRSESTGDAAVFGLFTALACLTKGNGVAVVLIPALLIPITGRWRLLRRPGLYVAAAIVVLLALPILAVSTLLDAQIGDFGPLSLSLIGERIIFYSGHLVENLGGLTLALAAVAAVVTVARARRSRPERLPLAETLIALAGAGIVFHLLTPHIISVSRYVTMMVAPIIGLAMVGVAMILERTGAGRAHPARFYAAMAVVVVAAFALRHPANAVSPMGYQALMRQLSFGDELAGKRMLVVSDESGEGAAVVEAALRDLRPAPMILRGSKLLAAGGWGSTGPLTHTSSDAVMQRLEDLHVDFVLLDRSPAAAQLPYYKQMLELTTRHAGRLVPVTFTAPQDAARELRLYRLKFKSPGQPAVLRIDLGHTLGRSLER